MQWFAVTQQVRSKESSQKPNIYSPQKNRKAPLLKHDAFNLIEADLVTAPVIELRRPRYSCAAICRACSSTPPFSK